MDVLDQGLLKNFLDKIDQPRKQQISIIINNEDIQKELKKLIANNTALINAIRALTRLSKYNKTNKTNKSYNDIKKLLITSTKEQIINNKKILIYENIKKNYDIWINLLEKTDIKDLNHKERKLLLETFFGENYFLTDIDDARRKYHESIKKIGQLRKTHAEIPYTTQLKENNLDNLIKYLYDIRNKITRYMNKCFNQIYENSTTNLGRDTLNNTESAKTRFVEEVESYKNFLTNTINSLEDYKRGINTRLASAETKLKSSNKENYKKKLVEEIHKLKFTTLSNQNINNTHLLQNLSNVIYSKADTVLTKLKEDGVLYSFDDIMDDTCSVNWETNFNTIQPKIDTSTKNISYHITDGKGWGEKGTRVVSLKSIKDKFIIMMDASFRTNNSSSLDTSRVKNTHVKNHNTIQPLILPQYMFNTGGTIYLDKINKLIINNVNDVIFYNKYDEIKNNDDLISKINEFIIDADFNDIKELMGKIYSTCNKKIKDALLKRLKTFNKLSVINFLNEFIHNNNNKNNINTLKQNITTKLKEEKEKRKEANKKKREDADERAREEKERISMYQQNKEQKSLQQIFKERDVGELKNLLGISSDKLDFEELNNLLIQKNIKEKFLKIFKYTKFGRDYMIWLIDNDKVGISESNSRGKGRGALLADIAGKGRGNSRGALLAGIAGRGKGR